MSCQVYAARPETCFGMMYLSLWCTEISLFILAMFWPNFLLFLFNSFMNSLSRINPPPNWIHFFFNFLECKVVELTESDAGAESLWEMLMVASKLWLNLLFWIKWSRILSLLILPTGEGSFDPMASHWAALSCSCWDLYSNCGRRVQL